MSSDDDNKLSLAVKRNVYEPVVENDAVVLVDDALPNVTVPGPLTLDHAFVMTLPDGSPSSVANPANVAASGNEII
jgi:hypothetical protein